MRMRYLRVADWTAARAAAALLLGLAVPALGQTEFSAARITGTVKDVAGGLLPGVTVAVKSVDTGRVVETVTNGRGFYRFVDLPTGRYEITAALQGFNTAKMTGVRLTLGSSLTIDFTLRISRAVEAVTVTSEMPMVEVTNTTVATTIQTAQIRQLPSNGRNFTNLVLALPESTTQNERGYLSLSGQRGINTSIIVDGVTDDNPFAGGATGQAENRAPLQISQESIKEISVITNGASAEFGRSGGGFVNIITKSGTNSFKGSAWYYNQPNSMLAKRADGTSLPNQKKEQYGVALGGPIVTDKLFFFVSYDKQKQTANYPILALGYDPAVAAKYPYFASATNFDQTRDGQVAFARMDYQFSGSHRLTARVNYGDYTGLNGTSNASYNATGHNGIEHMYARTYVVNYAGVFGANWINDANVQYVDEDTPRLCMDCQYPEIQVLSGGADFGGVSFLPVNPTQVVRKEVADSLTYLYKDHVFKAGFDWNRTSLDEIFKGNWRGVYIFPNQAAFLAGQWVQYRQFGGLGGLTADQAGRANIVQKELALFVQDQWFITSKLTGTLGLRVESLYNPTDPVLNASSWTGAGNYALPLNGRIPDCLNQFSPRLGLTWSPGNDGKSVLRLSMGRFWSRTPSVLFAQLYISNGMRGTQYTITTAAGKAPTDPLSPGWGTAFDPTILAPIDFSKVPNPTGLGVFTIDPNFKNPYTDRITLGFEREFLKDTAVSLNATYAQGHQLERLTDINLQYKTDANGNVVLSPINGQPMFNGTSPAARPNHYYARVTEYVSDAASDYRAIDMVLRRRFSERLFGFLAVTYSIDKDSDSNERNSSAIVAENVYNAGNDWGYAIRDQRWKVALNGVWNTPWWGISLSGVYHYVTGSPFNPITTSDANGEGNYTDRPTINGVHLARNSYRYPDQYVLELRLQKAFAVGPGNVAVIVECFNCTNAPNWGISNTTWGDGQTPLMSFNVKDTPTSYVRTFQFALRYDF
jgi:hypothetical protein